jgi:hypothetical protein
MPISYANELQLAPKEKSMWHAGATILATSLASGASIRDKFSWAKLAEWNQFISVARKDRNWDELTYEYLVHEYFQQKRTTLGISIRANDPLHIFLNFIKVKIKAANPAEPIAGHLETISDLKNYRAQFANETTLPELIEVITAPNFYHQFLQNDFVGMMYWIRCVVWIDLLATEMDVELEGFPGADIANLCIDLLFASIRLMPECAYDANSVNEQLLRTCFESEKQHLVAKVIRFIPDHDEKRAYCFKQAANADEYHKLLLHCVEQSQADLAELTSLADTIEALSFSEFEDFVIKKNIPASLSEAEASLQPFHTSFMNYVASHKCMSFNELAAYINSVDTQNNLVRAFLNFSALPAFSACEGSWLLRNALLWKSAVLVKLCDTDMRDEIAQYVTNTMLKLMPNNGKIYAVYTALITFILTQRSTQKKPIPARAQASIYDRLQSARKRVFETAKSLGLNPLPPALSAFAASVPAAAVPMPPPPPPAAAKPALVKLPPPVAPKPATVSAPASPARRPTEVGVPPPPPPAHTKPALLPTSPVVPRRTSASLPATPVRHPSAAAAPPPLPVGPKPALVGLAATRPSFGRRLTARRKGGVQADPRYAEFIAQLHQQLREE